MANPSTNSFNWLSYLTTLSKTFELQSPLSWQECLRRFDRMIQHQRKGAGTYYFLPLLLHSTNEGTEFRIRKSIGRGLRVDAIGQLKGKGEQQILITGQAQISQTTLISFLVGIVSAIVAVILFIISGRMLFALLMALFTGLPIFAMWLYCLTERDELLYDVQKICSGPKL